MSQVMVYIHGGAFIFGGALIYRPTALVTANDIIVVTVQYRLGGFGFLSSEDDVVPGLGLCSIFFVSVVMLLCSILFVSVVMLMCSIFFLSVVMLLRSIFFMPVV